MRKITLTALTVLLILSTCQKDETAEDPPVSSTEYLAEATIDASGGTLQHADFELVVPAGAFSKVLNLKLAMDESAQPMGSEQSGPVYLVEGLPLDLSKPLTVKIRITGGGKEELFAAVGEENFTPSADTVQTSYRSLPVTIESGWATFDLPALAKGQKSTGTSDTFPLKFTLFGGYQVFGEGTRFLVHAPPSLFLEAEALHGYLEEAYVRFQDDPFNFSYENRTSWPVSVTVKKLQAGLLGAYSNSKWGDNHGYIEFNRTEMENLAELRITAGHEFFHLVQSLYDPRSGYAKAVHRPAWHWMNEAFAVWAEEFYSDNPGYVSSIREHTQTDPFDGPIAGAKTEPGLHGYGMAAWLKYIHEDFPATNKSYNLVYDQIASGKGAVDALGILQDEIGINVWYGYDSFLVHYAAQQVYPDIQLDHLKDRISEVFWVQDEEDTLAEFNNLYADYSVHVFEVLLDYTEMKEGTSIWLRPLAPDVSMSLYRYKGEQISLIGEGFAGVIAQYTGLKEMMDSGWNLLLLVVNEHFESPYTGTQNKSVKISIDEPELELPPHLDYTLLYNFSYKWSNDTTIHYEYGGFLRTNFVHNGTLNEDGLYTAWWDSTDYDGWHHKGSLSAEIDLENQHLSWIAIRDMMNTGTVKDTFSFVVEEIPAVLWDEEHIKFESQGSIVNHITYVYHRRFAYGNTLTLLNFNCSGGCVFSLSLDKFKK